MVAMVLLGGCGGFYGNARLLQEQSKHNYVCLYLISLMVGM